jgi:hypothetical protein
MIPDPASALDACHAGAPMCHYIWTLAVGRRDRT